MIALIDADSLMFQACFNVENRRHALDKYDDLVESIKVECFADDIKLAIKGEDNFRYKLTDDYKANRQGGLPEDVQTWLPVIREHALTDGAIAADGMEADDLVAQWAYEAGYQDVVICHMDKDLDMIPGDHYNYHYNKMKHYTLTAEEATRNFYMQLLMGDNADNIKCIHGIGPAKAAKIINGVDLHHCKDMVMSLWERRVPDWQNKMLIAGNLLWLRRFPEDHFTFEHGGKTYAPDF